MASSKPNGYGTVRLGGQERPFTVDFEQGLIFARLPNRLQAETGAPMALTAYSDLFNPLTDPAARLTGEDYRDFTYSALVAGAEEDGLRVDFSPRMVSRWLDECDDANEASKPLSELYKQMTVKVERQIERLKNEAASSPAAAGPKPANKTKPAGKQRKLTSNGAK